MIVIVHVIGMDICSGSGGSGGNGGQSGSIV